MATQRGAVRRRYWVISANVNGPGTVRDWVPVILRDRAAFMGWHGARGDSARARGLAADFDRVGVGDAVLLAHGGLREPGQRRLVACGVAAGRGGCGETPDARRHRNCIRLDPFVPLDDDPRTAGIDFAGTPYFGTAQPVAIFEIDPADTRYPGNAALAARLDELLGGATRGAAAGPAGIRRSDLSRDCVEVYPVRTPAQLRQATRREQRLVAAYAEWLRAKGAGAPGLVSYRCPNGWAVCDVFDSRRQNLIEAKASLCRSDFRMAIGQLLDYQFLHRRETGVTASLGVLLPARPADDLLGLASALCIAVIWPEANGFADSVGGAFS